MTAPTTGATAKESLDGPGAGASAASAAVAEAAATRMAQLQLIPSNLAPQATLRSVCLPPMAFALFSPSALLSTASAAAVTPSSSAALPSKPLSMLNHKPLSTALAAAATAAVLLSAAPAPSLADPTFNLYYGTAASAANYGGYGGNADKKATAEYTYEVPDGWKERLVSKVEKGTNGTDSEFYNPKKRSEREYLTFLPGLRALAPVDAVLSNLALSDVGLQDQIATADEVRSQERKDDNGQLYYAYEIEGAGAHSLIYVTCARNKLYAHFVTAPNLEWKRDQDMLRRLHDSFKTIEPSASSS